MNIEIGYLILTLILTIFCIEAFKLILTSNLKVSPKKKAVKKTATKKSTKKAATKKAVKRGTKK
jgi:hypothetical protein